MTDYIVAGLFSFFIFRGALKGFLCTLLGPFSLLVSFIAAFIYFRCTQNLLISLAISILCPFILHLIFAILLRIWHKAIPVSLLSRIAGACFSTLWSGSIVVLVIILISLAPKELTWFQKIQNNVLESRSFAFIKKCTGNKIPNAISNINKITDAFRDPKKTKKLASTEEFKEIMEHEQFQALFSDEETAKQIQDKNIPELLTNPKIQSLLNNKDLLKKFLNLNEKIIEKKNAETAE